MYWSPDDRQFAVTNYVGSNVAETLIYKAGDTSRPVDVTDLLPKEVHDYFGASILHGYIEAVAWDKGGLIIRAFGDREDNPRSFDILLKCSEEKGKWTCKETAAKNGLRLPLSSPLGEENCMRSFKQTSRSGSFDKGISEIYQCQENPMEEVLLTYHYNYYTSLGRQNSSIRWSFIRGEQTVYPGIQDIPIGDYLSNTLSWKEQLRRRIGEFTIQNS
jgi:hypothetical protein